MSRPKHKNDQARNNAISLMNILELKELFFLEHLFAKSFPKIQTNALSHTAKIK